MMTHQQRMRKPGKWQEYMYFVTPRGDHGLLKEYRDEQNFTYTPCTLPGPPHAGEYVKMYLQGGRYTRCIVRGQEYYYLTEIGPWVPVESEASAR